MAGFSLKRKNRDVPNSAAQKNIRRQNVIMLIYSILIIILLNIIGSFVFTRFDLTAEKRYTLSDVTKKMLSQVDDYVYFKIYLEGDFPAGFKRLRNETREMLDEFRAYNEFIGYEFINPNVSSDEKERDNTYRLLIEKGLKPTELNVKAKEGSKQQIIFPGAMVSYKGRETSMHLLLEQLGSSSETVLNNSIQNLEFNLATAVNKLIINDKPKIAFITGHGELNDKDNYSAREALSEYYSVEKVQLNGKINALTERNTSDSSRVGIYNKYTAIIIAKPDSAFSEKDKFIIDQFLMRGGKILWLVDGVNAEMDSLQKKSSTLGLANEINIEDQLFKYGVRINPDLILDVTCLPIVMITGRNGDQPKFGYLPWMFFPLLNPTSKHPIVNNLNGIRTQFTSSIDTIGIKNVKKTILLSSSQYSRSVSAPVIIDLEMVKRQPDERLFTQANIPVAVLLEGKFESLFKNRVPAEIREDRQISFVENSRQTQVIVVSDGDVIRNQTHRQKGYPLPLGFDQDTRQSFGNGDFILNAMNYLVDDSRLISIRSRELKIRLLDRKRVEAEKLQWQILNIGLPILLVIFFALLWNFFRKRRYTR